MPTKKTKSVVERKPAAAKKQDTVKKVSKSSKTSAVSTHQDKFLFNFLVFIGVLVVFNFCFEMFDVSNKIVQKNEANNINTASLEKGLSQYSENGVSFSYPKASTLKKNSNTILIDNWSINFYNKTKDYINFNGWLSAEFKNPNCSSMPLDTDKNVNLSYSLYFVQGNDCDNSGLYMVGSTKIAKVELGSNPSDSYEQVLASMRF